MMPTLGVFGGMFDPVHDGHLLAAQFAIEEIGLHKLMLIPCGLPNHRAMAISGGEHRLNMLLLATADNSQLQISDYEIGKEAVSYTVDTLTWLKQQEPSRVLVFIIGMDAFNGFLHWHRWQEILALSNLLVLPRSGLTVAAEVADAVQLAECSVPSPEGLTQQDAGTICVATDFDYDISSTTVREQLMSGQQPQCVHPDVLKYIKEHRLYGQG